MMHSAAVWVAPPQAVAGMAVTDRSPDREFARFLDVIRAGKNPDVPLEDIDASNTSTNVENVFILEVSKYYSKFQESLNYSIIKQAGSRLLPPRFDIDSFTKSWPDEMHNFTGEMLDVRRFEYEQDFTRFFYTHYFFIFRLVFFFFFSFFGSSY